MKSTLRRPQHPSYLSHRRQFVWQIILPVVLAGLIMIGVVFLVWSATFRGNGDVSRWAAISTVWLVLPVMVGGLITLVALVGVAYLLGLVGRYIPQYSYLAQQFASRVQAGVKQAAEAAHKPRLMLREIAGLAKNAAKTAAGMAFKRLR
jgi:hypothetical protein